MQNSATFDRFLGAIEVGDDQVTEALVGTLTREHEASLLSMLNSDDEERKWWAARALAHCGGSLSVSPLAGQLTAADASLRAAVLLALAHLHGRQPESVLPIFPEMVVALVDDDGLVRQTAADALAICGDDAVETLAGVLSGSQDGARVRAASALRRIATMRSAGVLFRYLNDSNYLVRTYAYEGLDEMGLLDNVIVTL
jgi:HEAT repeat protein